jgi:hypothetical protein
VIPNPDADKRPILHDVIVDVLGKTRNKIDKQIDATVSEVKEWFKNKLDANLGALEGRIAQQIGQYAGRADTLGTAIEKERADRRTEIESVIKALEEKTAARLTAFEERMTQQVGQCSSCTDTLSTAIEKERADRHAEIEAGLAEVRRALEEKTEAKLTALEEQKALQPARLPLAKAFRPGAVHYTGEVVVHQGATYQALHDTAGAPPHVDDWICLASAGRDAASPTIRGTFNVYETYKKFDIVASDGGSFIARRDNPGILGDGDGWQLLARQGRPGRKGDTGSRGERGERGEKGPAVMPKLISSKIDENYNLVILRADDSLEIIPLREGYERYHHETSE